MNDIVKRRRPWLAVLLSLLTPGVGQLYCRRPKRAFVWLALTIIWILGYFLFQSNVSLAEHRQLFLIWAIAFPPIWIAGMVDAWRIAKQVGASSLAWYNKWYVYLPIILIINLTAASVPSPEASTERFSMPSASMSPTLVLGDIFTVSTSVYRTAMPQPGDVVVVKKEEGGRSFVKRVIAVAGDRVQMKEGRLYINGAMVEREPLGDYDDPGNGTGSAILKLYRETLPNGRRYQIVELSDKEFFDNTPEFLVPPGQVFLLGDNRDSSMDSRAPGEFGFIALAHVIGRVVKITGSEDPSRVGMEVE